MSPQRKLVVYPDVRLRSPSAPVKDITARVRRLVAEMTDILAELDGVGLSAIQVGDPSRVFIIDGELATGHKDAPPAVFINPVIVWNDPEHLVEEEGCLSLPGHYLQVPRAKGVRIRALNIEGREFTVDAVGLYARALQHEMDHLNGRVIVDLAVT